MAFLLLEMDDFAWKSVSRVEFFGFLAITAALWPLAFFKKPIILLKPATIFESELENANIERYRYELENRPPYCSARVLMKHNPGAGQVAQPTELTFNSEDVETILMASSRFGPFDGRDDKALLSWVNLAVLCDDTKTEVPFIWERSFNRVADELIYKGLGECYCPACSKTYSSQKLISSTGTSGFGWIQNRYSCPEGHVVMSYDFIKVFCGCRH